MYQLHLLHFTPKKFAIAFSLQSELVAFLRYSSWLSPGTRRERFISALCVALFDSNPRCGLASYLAVGLPRRCMFPLSRRFAPRRRARPKVAKLPSPSSLNLEFQCSYSIRSSHSLSRFSPLIHYPTTTHLRFCLRNPFLGRKRACRRQARGQKKRHPHTHIPPPHHRISSLPSLPAE